MFLTLDILERYGACESGKKWFARNFPKGAELIDVITHKTATPEILHWGYNHLTTNEAEREAYWKKLEVVTLDRDSIYNSDHVSDCTYVSRSSKVKLSNFIFNSIDIYDSNNVSSSRNVEHGHQVLSSEFVYYGEQIMHSKNVNECTNIINSDYVVRSTSVMNSAVVTDSHYIHGLAAGQTRQIKNSAFIFNCQNIKNCMFCTGIHDVDYQLFNQPIDPDQFDLIMKQMKKVMDDWRAEYVKGEWPEGTIPLDFPAIQRNTINQFANLPEAFWRWVKTLPGYDPNILYAIIFQADLIQ